MSEETKDPTVAEDLLSGSEDTFGSSISLSLGESSVRLRDKSKTVVQSSNAQSNGQKVEEAKWWLKRPETRLGLSVAAKNSASIMGQKDAQTTDVTSSMKEFLEKEQLCKTQPKTEGEMNKDDTLCDILASAAFDKYPSDFENATDEDIGSFLEEMSKIAGALSPSSAPERTKSGEDSSKNPTEEERSVEELLEEAEKLVRENIGLSKSSSRTVIHDEADNVGAGDNTMVRLEKDIFALIEQEVHRESEKIRKSPKNEKKMRETSPGNEFVYEKRGNSLKPPKLMSLESQRKRFDDEKVEVSSSSDLDDPIDRHSKSEDNRNAEEIQRDKENLQKEITDVDKDFFDDLLKRSKAKAEGGLSGSSSFGQEDFSHFLRILQVQDRREVEMKDARGSSKMNKTESIVPENDVPYPEKEITEILEKELPERPMLERSDGNPNNHEYGDSDSSGVSVESKSRKKRNLTRNSSEDRSRQSDKRSNSVKNSAKRRNSSEIRRIEGQKSSEKLEDAKNRGHSSKDELYTVDLTPRLELFADAIPKLIAEKSAENVRKEATNNPLNASTESQKNLRDIKDDEANEKDPEKLEKPQENVSREPDNEKLIQENIQNQQEQLCSSKSYDQLIARPANNLKSSLDDVRIGKPGIDARRASQPKSAPVGMKNKGKQIPSPSRQQQPKTKLSLKPSTSKFTLLPKPVAKPEMHGKYWQGSGDSRRNLSKDDFEVLCREERHKNSLLKRQIDSEAKMYKQQMETMRTAFEEELFALKKQNIILKAKIEEMSLNGKRHDFSPQKSSETRVKLLESELEKQEGIINAYETENKKLVIETARMQEELKTLKSKQRSKVEVNVETQKFTDEIKDLREEALKLNLEISDLREKNSDALLKLDDVSQQNSLLKEELEMFKEQLRTKNDFIKARLQSITASELESRKKADDLRVDLSSKSEQLRNIKIEYEKLEQAFVPLQKEVSEARARENNLVEKLQISKSHVEREKLLTIKLKDQVILDNKKILDLNRQVREMERILKRKNPDSVSALILTAKSDHERINLEKIKLLEDRVASLEGEIKANEQIGKEKLTDLQTKFSDMKEKYALRVVELEEKLAEALETRERMNKSYDASTQTAAKSVENKCVEAGNSKRDERERSSSLQLDRDDKRDGKLIKSGPKSQNPKEDAHLLATIRGLKMEIANKDKSLSKFGKEFQELQKTNRRLQKEREKFLNDRKNYKIADIAEKNGRSSSLPPDQRIQGVRTADTNDLNSNHHYQNGHLSNGNSQRLSGSITKLYDPLQYSENEDKTSVKKLTNENGILKEELNKINKDFMSLKNKRLHDLNLLQEEHEREMATLVKEYSVKFGDSKVVKLQGQINTQVAIITHLKEQIEKLRDYKEQVLVLKVEREHLENKVKILNEKVKYLSTPGTEQLQLLQDKITILQQRHESREMTLQGFVRDLLRNKNQCRDCKGEKVKNNKQLCYFRQELDNILAMLQEISNVH